MGVTMENDLNVLLWDTGSLYPGPASRELEEDFAAAAAAAGTFRERYRGRVAELDAASLLQALIAYEALEELIVKPQLYAHLLFAADSEDDVNKRLSQKAAEFGNLMSRELLFFDLEIIQLADDAFTKLVGDAQLANYRHYLESLRKFHPHTLPEREEGLLKQKSLTGAEAFSRLFDEVSAPPQIGGPLPKLSVGLCDP